MTTAMADTDNVYLSSRSKVELLACRWYAWPHLVSPVQQGINIAFRQLPLLRSFLANPSVHDAAARDPEMLGGPFVRLHKSECGAVESLVRDTLAKSSELIKFAEDLKALDKQLQDTAKGFSLENFYRDLPESLRGVVELVYDINNHPRIRLVEGLLAGGALDNSKTQEICLHEEADNQRDFFLNTPRMDGPGRIFLKVPFLDPRLDRLAAMRLEPAPIGEIERLLEIEEDQKPAFRSLFTDRPPRRRDPNFIGEGVRVRYFGHACVLVQSADVSILFDPVVGWDEAEGEGKFTFADLPDHIDYVVLTHDHQDHFSPETLVQLRRRIGHVLVPRNNSGNPVDPSMKLTLKKLGFDNVTALDPFDSVQIPNGEILSLPTYGEHADLDISSKQSAFIRLKDRSLLFLCDADCVDRMLYRRISQRVGPVDTLFIGMECVGAPLSWLYGPYLGKQLSRKDDESRRLNGSDSVRAWDVVQEINCKQVYVYAMGLEPWLSHLLGLAYTPDSTQMVESEKFIERCRASGIGAERLKGSRDVPH